MISGERERDLSGEDSTGKDETVRRDADENVPEPFRLARCGWERYSGGMFMYSRWLRRNIFWTN
jgi:hypothetical protein